MYCYCSDGVRLCHNGTVAANRPIYQLPDNTRVNKVQWWNDIKWGKPTNSEKKLSMKSQCHFTHHKSHWTDLSANLGHHSENLGTNCLSYGTASLHFVTFKCSYGCTGDSDTPQNRCLQTGSKRNKKMWHSRIM